MENRFARIILELLLPGFLGSIVFTIFSLFDGDAWFGLDGFLGVVFWAYIFVGIQSIAYAVIMEILISKNIPKDTLIHVSAIVGGLSGLITGGFFNFGAGSIFCGIGVIVGILIPIILVPSRKKNIEW